MLCEREQEEIPHLPQPTLFDPLQLTTARKEHLIVELTNKTCVCSSPVSNGGGGGSRHESNQQQNEITNTFSNGCLGSHNDEERSEMRYVMRIAKSSESSKF